MIIHGSALAVLNILTYALWISIALCGNVAYQFLFKLASWPISAGMVLPAIQKFPITIGFVLVSMAHGSCGGLALICAALMYFILISKMYEDYLEEFVFKTAAVIAEKLFGKKSPNNTTNPMNRANENIPAPAIAESGTNTQRKEKTEIPKRAKEQKKQTQHSQKQYVIDSSETKKSHNIVGVTTSKTTTIEKKNDLNVPDSSIDGEGAIVASDPENSFEVLYNQLDPEDVAQFTEVAETEEMDEETKKEMELKEAGKETFSFFRFKHYYFNITIHLKHRT